MISPGLALTECHYPNVALGACRVLLSYLKKRPPRGFSVHYGCLLHTLSHKWVGTSSLPHVGQCSPLGIRGSSLCGSYWDVLSSVGKYQVLEVSVPSWLLCVWVFWTSYLNLGLELRESCLRKPGACNAQELQAVVEITVGPSPKKGWLFQIWITEC